MLEPEIANTGPFRGSLGADERRVALAERNDLTGRILRQKFAKAPNAAGVFRGMRRAPFEPAPLQVRRLGRQVFESYLQQVPARGARKRAVVQLQPAAAVAHTTPEIGHPSSKGSIRR